VPEEAMILAPLGMRLIRFGSWDSAKWSNLLHSCWDRYL